jgi:hypothetical protein
MKKKIIGIDVNEILRATWLQFDKFYYQEFGEDGIPDEPYVFDFFNNYEWNDVVEENQLLNEDLPDDISEMEYQLDENGVAPVDAFAFRKEVVKLTAKEVYNRFMYVDFLFELFGSAGKMYPNVDVDCDKFYKLYGEQYEVMLFSKENIFSVSPTLFFLSKLRPKFKEYFFSQDNDEILDKMDIVITTDPELLDTTRKNKTIIKLDRPYNKTCNSDLNTINLIDLVDLMTENEDGEEVPVINASKDFQKLIKYKAKK